MVLRPPAGFAQFADLCRQIQQNFAPLAPSAPVMLPQFTHAGLPAPAAYEGGLIYVSDLNTVAMSNGVHWLPLTTGAAL